MRRIIYLAIISYILFVSFQVLLLWALDLSVVDWKYVVLVSTYIIGCGLEYYRGKLRGEG